MRYRAIVAYDGTGFLGWQSQAGKGRTVQDVLEQALSTALRGEIRIHGAGRTDTGVHARGQVIAFDLPGEITDLERSTRSVNGLLPVDVSLRRLERAAEDFDPRRHAVQRAYDYQVWNSPVRSPFLRGQAWHVWQPLDLSAMREAASYFVGTHDFASFQGSDNFPRPSVRRVSRSEWQQEGQLLRYRIEANAFARHMVRNIVGQVVQVGMGKAPPSRIPEVLAARDRTQAAATAPPQGLFLAWVRYGESG